MNFRPRIPFEALPAGLQALLVEPDFIVASESENAGHIIVWVVNRAARGQLEIEYARSANRLLSRSEREALFPPLEEVLLPALDVRVSVGHTIADDNGTLLQTYDVTSLGADGTSLRCLQMVYAPLMRPVADVVSDALTTASFPARYARWSDREKIGYWAAILYRQWRQAGENGQDEEIVFSVGLLAEMRAIDPQIDSLLAPIIADLAGMVQMNVAQLRASFSARTGAAISWAPQGRVP